ncbi:MAG TPA: hypothetical protein VLA37_05955, partial [Sphingomonadaceae bacterium]|nr:hypothetical protein [Sphingomonadaceae bacterium]
MSIRALIALSLLAAPIAAQAEHHEPTAEERLQRLEAESAIRRILVEYGAFLDGRDYAAYAALFA